MKTNLTKTEAKFLKRLLDSYQGDSWADGAYKARMDAINRKYPGVFEFMYGGMPCTVGEHAGSWRYCLTYAARKLREDYEATEIVGYDGTASVINGYLSVEFEFHYRVDSLVKLNSQLTRAKKFHKVTIIKVRPLTHAQWVFAYGWGRM